jgi:DNA-binding NtrC family response regulator
MQHNDQLLIVEDNEDCATQYKEILNPYFKRIDCVRNVADATHFMAIMDVCCIVLDLNLPNGKGVRLVDDFQNLHPDIPLIVISGCDVDEEKVILAGAHAFIRKGHSMTGCADTIIRTVIQSIWRHRVRSIYKPVTEEVQKIKEEQAEMANTIESAKQELNPPT